MTILAREQSENLNQRLRELCAGQVHGTRIREILNRELALDPPWTLNAFWGRAKKLGVRWIATPKAGRPIGGAQYLPEDQRQACYQDPAYEARNRISDRIVCRECFQLLKDGSMQARAGNGGHLCALHDKMKLKQYRLRNPGAPIFTCERIAKQEGRDVAEVIARQADEYATPAELAAAQKDRHWEEINWLDYVICRVDRCGFKSFARLDKHLHNAHAISTKKYRHEWQWPIMTRLELDQHKRNVKDARAELKTAAKKAWRPQDWDTKWSADEQFVAVTLIETPTISNSEIGIRLDQSRFPCPFGGMWEESLTEPGSGANWIYRLRKRLKQAKG